MSSKTKKFIHRYQFEICIAIISLIALIIGTLAIGFLKAFLIVGAIDLLLIVPGFLQKKPVQGKHVKGNNHKDETKRSSSTKGKKDKKKKVWWKKLLLVLLILFIIGMILFSIFMAYIVISAPKFDPDNLYRTESSILYDKNGKIFAKLGAEKREKISYDEMPEVLIDAIIATEDSRFFQHNGFDLPRFMKASFGQLLGRDAGGASTLTMQVSKNNYTSTTASGWEGIKRKFTDIYMSIFQIEKKYSKQEILEFYVNQPYLGSGAYGVEQACQTYFGKSAKDINLAEAALIAGLFQAPNAYDPYLNPEASEKRRNTVLYLMERHGYISKEEREAAEKIPVEELLTKSAGEKNKFQSFIDTVIDDVEKKTKMSPYNVAMEIYTTMDPELQQSMDDIMNGKTFNWENDAVTAGVAVLDVKTGAIVAIGAGRNQTGERTFNNATMIKRQIGSTAKPLYDYAMGFEKKGWSTYQPFADEPHGYTNSDTDVDNWNRTFQGFMTLRNSLAESRNIPALKAFQMNSKKDIANFVESVGLSPEYENGVLHEAHALGGYNGESPLTVAAAYSSFASGGYYTEPYTFSKIVYRETITKEAIGDGRYIKQSGGAGYYGVVQMRFSPSDHTHFTEEVFGGAVPKNYFPAVEKGFLEALQQGLLAGFPVINVKATLLDGKYHSVDSNEMAFKMAAILAFKDAYMKANPIILEPIYKIKVNVNNQYVGDVLSDLNQKRGKVLEMNDQGEGNQEIVASVPEAEILNYAQELKAITQSSAYFNREFLDYEEVPAYLKDKVIEQNKLN